MNATYPLPTSPTTGQYFATKVEALPNRWEVHCWCHDEHQGKLAWVFTEAFDGEYAATDALTLAAHLNAGGC